MKEEGYFIFKFLNLLESEINIISYRLDSIDLHSYVNHQSLQPR